MSDVLPPVTGIARKERRDKGVPRKSNIAAMSDQFMALELPEQVIMLEVLQALHRQVVKGRIASRLSVSAALVAAMARQAAEDGEPGTATEEEANDGV
jgi:hypothetical protein